MKNIDMTTGSIWKQMTVYMVPILFGELLQQLYNTIDTVVLGNFAGDIAMAAVGGTSNIIKAMVGFFNGVSIGCTVVVARYFGAKDPEKLQQSIHSIIYLTFTLGTLLSVVGVFFAPYMLRLLSMPDTTMPLALTYIRIYFAGMLGTILYNTVTGIFRAVGNVKLPVYTLFLSSVLNIVLDLVFVICFRWDVAGVAIATIIAQSLAAIVCLVILVRSPDEYRLRFDVAFNWEITRQVLRIGVPTGIQKTLTSLSNAVVLSYINFFGDASLAGWVVYNKVNFFIITGLQSMGASITTFVSQNVGAKNYQRARKGVIFGFWGSVLFACCMSLAIMTFREQIIRAFGQDADMFAYATTYIMLLIPLQPLHVPHSAFSAALRGFGETTKATSLMLLGLIVFRQTYLSIITQFINTPKVIALAFPIGWLSSGVMLFVLYVWIIKSYTKKNTRLQ